MLQYICEKNNVSLSAEDLDTNDCDYVKRSHHATDEYELEKPKRRFHGDPEDFGTNADRSTEADIYLSSPIHFKRVLRLL
jgi:hypothetical protein